jgi:osmotically-inducible protein OsmY
MMGLARRAEAALIEAGLLQVPSVSVVEPGRVQLTGIVSDQKTREKMEEILKGVRGVQSIENKILVVSARG